VVTSRKNKEKWARVASSSRRGAVQKEKKNGRHQFLEKDNRQRVAEWSSMSRKKSKRNRKANGKEPGFGGTVQRSSAPDYVGNTKTGRRNENSKTWAHLLRELWGAEIRKKEAAGQ